MKTTSGSESLLRTIKWMGNRIKKLERKVGLPRAGKIKPGRRG